MQPSCGGRDVEERDIDKRCLIHSGREHRLISPDWARGLTAIWRLAPGIPHRVRCKVRKLRVRRGESRASSLQRGTSRWKASRCSHRSGPQRPRRRSGAQSHANKTIHRRSIKLCLPKMPYNKDASGSSSWHGNGSALESLHTEAFAATAAARAWIAGIRSAVSTRTGSIGARHKVESVSLPTSKLLPAPTLSSF